MVQPKKQVVVRPKKKVEPTTTYGRRLQGMVYRYLASLKPKEKHKDFFDDYRYPALDRLFINLERIGAKFTRPAGTKRNVTLILYIHLIEIVIEDRNLIGICTGKPGLGKSFVGMALSLELKEIHRDPVGYINKFLKKHTPKDPSNRRPYELKKKQIKHLKELRRLAKKRKPKKTKIHFAFSFDQSKKKIKKMPTCHTLIQDEFTELIGEGAKNREKEFKNIVRQFRYTQKNLILNNPDYFYIPALNLIVSPIGQYKRYFRTKNPAHMITRILIRYVDDTERTRKPLYLGFAELNIAKAISMEKHYKKLKDDNYKELEEAGGKRTAKIDLTEFNKKADKLMVIAKKNKWDGRNKKLLSFYLQQSSIGYDTYEKDYLIEQVNKRFREEKKAKAEADYDAYANINSEGKRKPPLKTQQQESSAFVQHVRGEKPIFDITDHIKLDLDKPFEVPDDLFLRTIRKNPNCSRWENIKRNIKIFKEAKETTATINEIAFKYKIHRSLVSKIKNRYQGYINKYRGILYEMYYEQVLIRSGKYDEVIRDGRKGKPDIYAISKTKRKLYVFSIKCVYLQWRKKSLQIEQFNPELKFAKRNWENGEFASVTCKAIFWDDYGKTLYVKSLNFFREPKGKAPKTIMVERLDDPQIVEGEL